MSSTKRLRVISFQSPEGQGPGRIGGGVQRAGVPVEQETRARRARGRWTARAAVSFGAVLALWPASARAQPAEPPPAPPPPGAPVVVAAPPPAEPVAPAPPPMAPPPPPGGVLPAQSATPPLNTEAMPATRQDKLPPIDVGAWVRAGMKFQGPNPKSLGGERMDSIYGELHAGGKITPWLGVTLNLNANGLAGTAGIEDAIVQFDFADPFHVWVGQLLVPVDRANYGGPFFAIPWNYPGVLAVGGTQVFMTPKEATSGRDAGVVAWGDLAGGKFQYAVGAFQSGSAGASPLFSAHLIVPIIGEETGYFGNSTYFGDKNILSIIGGGQYQKNGSGGGGVVGPMAADYGEGNADLLAEFKYGGGGWVTGEAAYYHYAGTYEAIHNSFFILAAIATPQIGVGNIQPMVRYQYGDGDNAKAWAVDAFLSYLIKGPALRVMAGFQHTDLRNGVEGNSIQLESQAIFF